MTTPSQHDVLGSVVRMPVQIRHARCFVAGFTADAAAMQSAIDGNGNGSRQLSPLLVRPGRGMCMLVFVDYIDGDLGPYNEFGVCFLVANPAAPPPSPLAALRSLATGDARALIHHLPVDGEFTLAAGRGIWGFPKTLADFDVDHDSTRKHGRVSADGELIADLTVKPGLPVPTALSNKSSPTASLNAYSQLDGVLRSTPWNLSGISGIRTRVGGARLRLGTHPMAAELRALTLSRHALMTTSVQRLSMTSDDATDVGD